MSKILFSCWFYGYIDVIICFLYSFFEVLASGIGELLHRSLVAHPPAILMPTNALLWAAVAALQEVKDLFALRPLILVTAGVMLLPKCKEVVPPQPIHHVLRTRQS
jgi:hypothetical protein